MPTGITAQTVGDFLDGLDIVIEECDSLDAKVLIREVARTRRLPVLMATSDRGLLDVERFDLEPSRPIMHGLLGDVDSAQLANLSNKDKLPYALRMTDATQVSSRMAASLIEVGKTLSTWPQLSSEVALNAIGRRRSRPAHWTRREIALRQGANRHRGHARRDLTTRSGRRLTIRRSKSRPIRSNGSAPPRWSPPQLPAHPRAGMPSHGISRHVMVRCAFGWPPSTRQRWMSDTGQVPWRWERQLSTPGSPRRRTGCSGDVEFQPGDEGIPPQRDSAPSGDGDDPELARCTKRCCAERPTGGAVIVSRSPSETLALLGSAARSEGARLQILSGSAEIDRAAAILAAADRIRYLTPRLHAEMFAELRSPGDPSPESGIDVRSLELEPGGSGDARHLAAIGSDGEPRSVGRRNRAWRRHLRAGDRERRRRRDHRARPESDRLCPRWIGRRIGVDQSTTARACRPTGFTSVSVCARR